MLKAVSMNVIPPNVPSSRGHNISLGKDGYDYKNHSLKLEGEDTINLRNNNIK